MRPSARRTCRKKRPLPRPKKAASFENNVSALRNDFTALRGKVDLLTWMIGFNVAMTVALVGKVFLTR